MFKAQSPTRRIKDKDTGKISVVTKKEGLGDRWNRMKATAGTVGLTVIAPSAIVTAPLVVVGSLGADAVATYVTKKLFDIKITHPDSERVKTRIFSKFHPY